MSSARKWLWIVVAAQVLVLIGMIAEKEYALATGTPIRLASAPVDPVDLMRGDYVYLSYEISRLDCRRIAGCNESFSRGDSAYVELLPAGEIWHAEAVSHAAGSRPGAVYLRGSVTSLASYTQELSIEYGIESYYVAEHHGQAIEQHMPRRYQAPNTSVLSAEVIVPGSHYGQLHQLFWNGQPLLP